MLKVEVSLAMELIGQTRQHTVLAAVAEEQVTLTLLTWAALAGYTVAVEEEAAAEASPKAEAPKA